MQPACSRKVRAPGEQRHANPAAEGAEDKVNLMPPAQAVSGFALPAAFTMSSEALTR
jgi:hypothetical protein